MCCQRSDCRGTRLICIGIIAVHSHARTGKALAFVCGRSSDIDVSQEMWAIALHLMHWQVQAVAKIQDISCGSERSAARTLALVFGQSAHPKHKVPERCAECVQAIVGANAFAHESGIHQDGMLKNKETYEIITPEEIGLVRADEAGLVMGEAHCMSCLTPSCICDTQSEWRIKRGHSDLWTLTPERSCLVNRTRVASLTFCAARCSQRVSIMLFKPCFCQISYDPDFVALLWRPTAADRSQLL